MADVVRLLNGFMDLTGYAGDALEGCFERQTRSVRGSWIEERDD